MVEGFTQYLIQLKGELKVFGLCFVLINIVLLNPL